MVGMKYNTILAWNFSLGGSLITLELFNRGATVQKPKLANGVFISAVLMPQKHFGREGGTEVAVTVLNDMML